MAADGSTPKTADSKPAVPKKGRSRRPEAFEVSMWVTNFHDVEFGIYQHSRNQAKSRQFSKDMDIFGEVKVNGERAGLLAYRKDLWTESSGMEKRLVIKLFSPTLNWRGTIDVMNARSLQLTRGARGLPVIAMSANLDDHDHMVQIERSAHKWPGLPENYSFFTFEDGQVRFYRLRKKWLSIGQDYVLYDGADRKVGLLDGRVVNLGGKWKVRLDPEHATNKLVAVLQLFCGFLKFRSACMSHVSSLTSALGNSKLATKLEQTEADLYMNPRRVR